MSYKDELLKFLYKSNLSRTEIYPITDDKGYSNKEIKETISDLKNDEIIATDDKYRQIGGGDPKNLMTSRSLRITARLTPSGEKYVRETYFKEENEKTFSANQIVHINGDNSGQISQADNQSESIMSKIEATEKQNKAIVIQIIKYIFGVLGGIASLIAIYEFFIKPHIN